MSGALCALFGNNMMKIFKFFEKVGYVRAINRLKRRGLNKQAKALEGDIKSKLSTLRP
jgi:hypothetical protein|tara:strand:- start:1121 stop:1294 length:174 start_codon:yes stop_codon:yes gene_type:complete